MPRYADRSPAPPAPPASPAPPEAPVRRYPSLAAFYSDDPVRLGSRERDVGLWWRQEQADPLHRAAWVCETGELYLVRLGPLEEGGGAVEVLSTVPSEEQLEELLAGWREHCGERGSLAWLRRRVLRRSGTDRPAAKPRLRTV